MSTPYSVFWSFSEITSKHLRYTNTAFKHCSEKLPYVILTYLPARWISLGYTCPGNQCGCLSIQILFCYVYGQQQPMCFSYISFVLEPEVCGLVRLWILKSLKQISLDIGKDIAIYRNIAKSLHNDNFRQYNVFN